MHMYMCVYIYTYTYSDIRTTFILYSGNGRTLGVSPSILCISVWNTTSAKGHFRAYPKALHIYIYIYIYVYSP